MALSRDQLIDLYIQQKDAHIYWGDADVVNPYKKAIANIMQQHGVTIEEQLAPPLASISTQLPVPFILFKPKIVTPATPSPLIVHTHGGPHVRIDKNTSHAEISYYLSHGFSVACPNYRGSKLSEEKNQLVDPATLSLLKTWETLDNTHFSVAGPEDVYAVASFLNKQSFVSTNKIILRGGSFGSHINAHLLAAVQAGKFPNIFAGVHLSGGLYYPATNEMPLDLPMLITHGMKDEICAFGDARLFMEKMLRASQRCEILQKKPNRVQVFVAKYGDHHLIEPTLKQDAKATNEYKELAAYLKLSIDFVHAVVRNDFKADDVRQQLMLIAPAIKQENAADSKDRKKDDKESNAEDRAYHYVMDHASQPKKLVDAKAAASVIDQKAAEAPKRLSPTMAHLKLLLGKDYKGNVAADIKHFLATRFLPVSFETKTVLVKEGSEMLKDTLFVSQLIDVVEKEEAFLQNNPDHMVLYHTGISSALKLYAFINLWKNALRGQFDLTDQLTEMRLFDFLATDFSNIDDFLAVMQSRRDPDVMFNYTEGFQERALACNPTLFSNQYSTPSCTFKWFYYYANQVDNTPISTLLKEFFQSMGFYQPERVARYHALFTLEKNPNNVLQQIFLPYQLADQKAYVCQIWGEPLKANKLALAKPSTLRQLREDPVAFEAKLQENADVFTNYERLATFGIKGFCYSDVLQVRYIYQPGQQVMVNTTFRNPQQFRALQAKLSQFVKEDLADFLVCSAPIPKGVVSDADVEINKMRAVLGVKSRSNAALGFFLFQQKSKRSNAFLKQKTHNLFAPCAYIKNYTYSDLLQDAARVVLLEFCPPKAAFPHLIKQCQEKDYDFLAEYAGKFCTPESVATEEISHNNYQKLCLILDYIAKYYTAALKPEGLAAFKLDDSTQLNREATINHDLRVALMCIKHYARLTKDKETDSRPRMGK